MGFAGSAITISSETNVPWSSSHGQQGSGLTRPNDPSRVILLCFAIQQGERLANEERRRLGLGETALPDVAELLETQGVRTGVVDLPEDVSD
jgi:hypothetical protein